MKMIKKVFIYLLCSLISGCIFSSDNIKDYKIVNNFYVCSSEVENTLVYKNEEDLELICSGTVILNKVDSIGWCNSNILAVFNNQYFLIDTISKKVSAQYRSCGDFLFSNKNLKLTDFNLKKITVSN